MKATVIGLSDTWLDDDVHHYEINISGCSLECKDRKREGGGICTYVRNDLVFNRRTGIESELLEFIAIDIFLPRMKPIIVINAYRPPSV